MCRFVDEMGQPKALCSLGNQTLLERILTTLEQSSAQQPILATIVVAEPWTRDLSLAFGKSVSLAACGVESATERRDAVVNSARTAIALDGRCDRERCCGRLMSRW